MINVRSDLTPASLKKKVAALFDASAQKLRSLERDWSPSPARPSSPLTANTPAAAGPNGRRVFSSAPRSSSSMPRATGDFLDYGRDHTVRLMAPHVTHMGVHDHGFNNVSTYGNLLRLMDEGRIAENAWERRSYELALKCSGAVQAMRWSRTADGGGYIYSFNGPHSLFVDTIRSLRALAVSHRLGHVLMGENDKRISLLDRLIQHAEATARYSRLLRRRPRRLRRPRPHGARERLQRQRRQLPLPQFAAGLFAVQHLDARPRLGHVRVRRAARVHRTLSDGELEPHRRTRGHRSHHAPRRRGHLRFLYRELARRRHSLLGHRRADLHKLGDWASSPPIRSILTSRWTAPPPPSPRRGSCGSAAT